MKTKKGLMWQELLLFVLLFIGIIVIIFIFSDVFGGLKEKSLALIPKGTS